VDRDIQTEAQERIPHEVGDLWDAHGRYYADDTVTRLPRNVDIAKAYRPVIDERTFNRRKKDLIGKGKLGTRDWLEGVWPLPRDWRPSWLPRLLAQREQAHDVEDGRVRITYEEIYENGKLVERRLIRTLGHLSAAAAMFAFAVLDLSDGWADGVFRARLYLKHLLEEDFEHLATLICRVVT
jgi:hypothetical protein